MNIWLIYNKKDAERNRGYIQEYMNYSKKININLELVYVEDLQFGIHHNKLQISTKIKNKNNILPDAVINRTIYPLLTKQIEEMNIPVYNNAHIAEICNDKAKTYQYVSKAGVKILNTFFIKNNGHLPQQVKFPFVMKSSNGRGGLDVYFINSEGELQEKLQQFQYTEYVIQEPAGTLGKDLRVYVIGKKIVTAMLRSSARDFRANYCLGGEASVYTLSEAEKETVQKIINLFDIGLVGIDFLFDEDGNLVFNEIEDVVGARMVYEKTDINIAAVYLDFIVEQLKMVKIQLHH